MLTNVWNNIIEWFSDRSERNKLIRSFNKSAKDSFITGLSPTLLRASVSRGNSAYRHQFSAWMYTGFRIKALSGRALSKEEMMFIGDVVIANTSLVRRLIALGWDTLEIHDDTGIYGLRWKLIEYAQMGGLLSQSNN